MTVWGGETRGLDIHFNFSNPQKVHPCAISCLLSHQTSNPLKGLTSTGALEEKYRKRITKSLSFTHLLRRSRQQIYVKFGVRSFTDVVNCADFWQLFQGFRICRGGQKLAPYHGLGVSPLTQSYAGCDGLSPSVGLSAPSLKKRMEAVVIIFGGCMVSKNR